MFKHINIKIYGSVQGVSFRYYTQAKAKKLDISGFVRNEPDGTVYIEAEGEEEKLIDFLAWCRQGPKWAKATKIEHQISSDMKNYKSFIIQ